MGDALAAPAPLAGSDEIPIIDVSGVLSGDPGALESCAGFSGDGEEEGAEAS